MLEADQIPCDVLVIGGTSSLASPLIKLLTKLKCAVVATSRSGTQNGLLSDVKTWLSLDMSSRVSIEKFLATMGSRRFNLILIFIGAPSKDKKNSAVYVETYLTNMIFLIQNLLPFLKTNVETALVHVSSRSSLYPSRDVLNSAVKGGLNSALRSMTRHLPREAKMVSVAPGLILDSTMANNMPAAIRLEHIQRSSKALLDLDGFAEEFLKIIMKMQDIENGSVIELGPNYL
jgi:NAD(P)-dependent dehydrogenase (short-subunit alcohol dehydrogenase family)